jgi:hypothetical protein
VTKPAKVLKTGLEDDFAAALLFLGWQVLFWKDIPKDAAIDDKTIVRQWLPHCADPATGKLRRYAVDFAHPVSRIYCEIDGYQRFGGGKGGHATWFGFHRDREKDRVLVWNGWTPIRFGTGDLKDEGYKDAALFFDAMIRKWG